MRTERALAHSNSPPAARDSESGLVIHEKPSRTGFGVPLCWSAIRSRYAWMDVTWRDGWTGLASLQSGGPACNNCNGPVDNRIGSFTDRRGKYMYIGREVTRLQSKHTLTRLYIEASRPRYSQQHTSGALLGFGGRRPRCQWHRGHGCLALGGKDAVGHRPGGMQ